MEKSSTMGSDFSPYCQLDGCPRGEKKERHVRETLLTQVAAGWIPRSFVVAPDLRHVAYVVRATDGKLYVVVDGKEGKRYDDLAFLTFSPDGKRFAYAAKEGDKWLVVIDGKEEKKYNGIGEGTIAFSPNSDTVAYAAITDTGWTMVVNGNEGEKYDVIVTIGPKKIVFDPTENLSHLSGTGCSFRYLAAKGSSVYLVEERLK
ncbi:MAG: hypothetical protein N2234_00030 [Planctomycetota bacterium]|nr:hypothetical protein [Planctomycetota bacterium]